ncbi:hypothetical protein MWLp12_2541 [Lactiplantibacillus plantarum]|nr:hypothetical protein Nizo2802_0226 [Lactiplantibacillus plantarum]WCL69892.1 hypothetical protein MWLp12_2541 [Lactiplantibacillus plantarum]
MLSIGCDQLGCSMAQYVLLSYIKMVLMDKIHQYFKAKYLKK